jgi:hypothetical protein
MTIYLGSRYEPSLIDFISTTPGGNENPIVFYDFPNLGTLTYYEHTVLQGERLDQIANKYYNRSGVWWIILDHNPEIKDVLDIPAGTKLRIPRV